MPNRILNIPQGKLLFRKEDGLLHVINQQGEQLFQAYQHGFSVEDVCNHLEDAPPNECLQKLTELWQQWQTLSLNDANRNDNQRLPYRLLVRPSLEIIQITTNSFPVFNYLKDIYHAVYDANDQPMVNITVLQTESTNAYQVLVDGKNKYQTNDFEQTILATCFEIGEEATHEEPRLVVAHAAALAHEQNIWMLPAQSGNGKTTLTATLLKHGYKLINDDVVPVNHDGTVTTLNLPLKIKSGAWSILASDYPELQQTNVILRADELKMKNLRIPKTSLCSSGSKHRITGIIVPKYDTNQQEPSCEMLQSTSKLQAFLQAEPYFTHHLTQPYLQKILDWLEPIPAWNIRYSNSQQALQLIKHLESKSS